MIMRSYTWLPLVALLGAGPALAQPSKGVPAKKPGGAPPESGLSAETAALQQMAAKLPDAAKREIEALVAAATEARRVSGAAQASSRDGARAAVRQAQQAVFGLSRSSGDLAALRKQAQEVVQRAAQQAMAPLAQARTAAQQVAGKVQEAFKKVEAQSAAAPALAQAKKVLEAARREAALVVLTVRKRARRVVRRVAELVRQRVGKAAGGGLRRAVRGEARLSAFGKLVEAAPAQVKDAARAVEVALRKALATIEADLVQAAVAAVERAGASVLAEAKEKLGGKTATPEAVKAFLDEGRRKVVPAVKEARARAAGIVKAAQAPFDEALAKLERAGAEAQKLVEAAKRAWSAVRTRAAEGLLLARSAAKRALRQLAGMARALAGGKPAAEGSGVRDAAAALAELAANAPAEVKGAAAQVKQVAQDVGRKVKRRPRRGSGHWTRWPARPARS
jgi:hypothetical protein